MAQTLEAIRGGGGSVKVGTTGTISALMSRELESTKSASKAPSLDASISVSTGDEAPKRLKPRTSADEASSSSSSTGSLRNSKGPESLRRKHHTGGTPQIPMLASDVSIDGSPIRKKPTKKGPAIVDIKCGNPITHRLKKLGFSKLSDSVDKVATS